MTGTTPATAGIAKTCSKRRNVDMNGAQHQEALILFSQLWQVLHGSAKGRVM